MSLYTLGEFHPFSPLVVKIKKAGPFITLLFLPVYFCYFPKACLGLVNPSLRLSVESSKLPVHSSLS